MWPKGQVSPSPSSPTIPSPSRLGACGFDFLTPVPLRTGLISIQAHTEHCKLISLGCCHRKSGCQVLFPHDSSTLSASLGPTALRWASLYKLPVLILQFPFTLSAMPPACQGTDGGQIWTWACPLDSFLWPLLCSLPTIRESSLDLLTVLTC